VGFFPDPNCSYLVVVAMYLPFGSRVVIEGEFPHARFFDVQVTPSFQPELYQYDGSVGVAEVPLVNADIEPLPGHVNPFRIGADRTSKRRGYRVELDMAIGDPVVLNAALRSRGGAGRAAARAAEDPRRQRADDRRAGVLLVIDGLCGAERLGFHQGLRQERGDRLRRACGDGRRTGAGR
jgi:hypothetical protein